MSQHALKSKLDSLVRKIQQHDGVGPREEWKDSDSYWDFLNSQPYWSSMKSFERRFNELVKEFPEFDQLRPLLVEALELAEVIKELVKEDVKRKRLNREAQKLSRASKTSNGVKLGKADPNIVRVLMKELEGVRREHVEEAIQNTLNMIDDDRLLVSSGKVSKTDMGNLIGCRYNRFIGDKDPLEFLADPKFLKQQVDRATRDAEAGFDSFIVKSALKISQARPTKVVKKVSFVGQAWSGTMTVETDSGVQVWRTRRIVNRSPLGLSFYQWPTTMVS